MKAWKVGMFASLLALAGCDSPSPAEAPLAAAVAQAPAPDDLDCRGTEPFWLADLRGETLQLQWVGEAVETRLFKGRFDSTREVWSGIAADGSATRLELQPANCLDGMNDKIPAAPWQVTVVLPEGGQGKGCCAVKN